MQIHITRGEDSSGPFTLEQVRDYLTEGILLPDDLAWHEGLENWIPLSQLVAPPVAPQPVAPLPALPSLPSFYGRLLGRTDKSSNKNKSSKKPFLVVGIIVGFPVLGLMGLVPMRDSTWEMMFAFGIIAVGFLFIIFVKGDIKSGVVQGYGSRGSASSGPKVYREKEPIIFWLNIIPKVLGAALMLTVGVYGVATTTMKLINNAKDDLALPEVEDEYYEKHRR